MKLLTFTRLFYLSRFFFDFILIYAVEKLFFVSRGLNLSQIGILLFSWSVMTLVLEVPTGVLADRWSRRKMLILSGIFFSTCYLVWIFSNSFVLFLVGFFFRTLGSTFTSGTLQAYLYDFLKLHNQEDQFEKIWGRGNALRTLGTGVAVFLGGFLSQISYSIPLVISALSVFVVSITTFLWPEIPIITPTNEEKYWGFVKSATNTVFHNRNLLRIVLYSVIIFSAFSNLEEFNDIYLNFLGYPNYMMGIIFAIAMSAQSLASTMAHKFKNYSWVALDVTALIGIIILLLTAWIRHPLMAMGILFIGVLLEFSRVLSDGIIQKEVPPHQRATLASLNSFVSNIVPIQLVFGFIAYRYHLQLSYLFLAIYCTTYFLILPFIKKEALGSTS
ncbi:MAG: MFS transporter [Candidatus Amesbacteria bacterium]|nr:MFS transporter [Candidatus Amesbacteria bacterium]